jgi:hypothetical protein
MQIGPEAKIVISTKNAPRARMKQAPERKILFRPMLASAFSADGLSLSTAAAHQSYGPPR